MIGYYINHHEHVLFMAGIDQILEVFFGSEVVVAVVDLAGPVAMVPSGSIVDTGGDPDGIEPHTLDIVEIVDDTSIASSAVVS